MDEGPHLDGGPLRIEVCNGLDDDGDGLVDEGFLDVDGDGTADCVDGACEVSLPDPVSAIGGVCEGDEPELGPPPADPWSWVVEWEWNGAISANGGSVESTPAVGDLDRDGIPEVVVPYSATGLDLRLAVLDGATGVLRWSVGSIDLGGVALGDIDGDGYGDIVAFGENCVPNVPCERFLRALDRNGMELWRLPRDESPPLGFPNASITDLEGDGNVEVLAGAQVLDGATGIPVAELEGGGTTLTEYAMFTPVAADLDGDGIQEVLLNERVYDSHGNFLFSCGDGGPEVHAQPVNTDADPEGEVLVNGAISLTLCDDDGIELWTIPHTEYGGPVAAADFDGDGLQEFAYADRTALHLVDEDGSQIWSVSTSEVPANDGPVVWDINQDGVPEVIYQDNEDLWVVDGATGAVVMDDADCAVISSGQIPVVADVDNDGHGEIVVGSAWGAHGSATPWLGIHVIGSADGDWPWARPVFNQHGYWGGNIEDDLSVPTDTTPPWLSPENLFRGQASRYEIPLLPNLHAAVTGACIASCEPGGFAQVAVQVWNDGEADAAPGIIVRLYGTVADGLRLIEEHTLTDPLPAASSVEWLVGATVDTAGSELMVIVDEDGSVRECNDNDNVGIWEVALCGQHRAP